MAARQADERNEEVIFKNCTSFTDCVSEKDNTQVNDAKDLDVVVPMYNLIEYSDNYSKTSGGLWQYHRDEPALDNNGNIVNFPGNSASFNFKLKLTGKTPAVGNTKDVKITVPLKYLSNFLRTLQMLLINVQLILF